MTDEHKLETYVPTIDAILSVSDLELVTVKKIRFALEALFDVQFAEDRKVVNDLIMNRYYKLVEDRENSESTKPTVETLKTKDEEMAYKLQASLNARPLRSLSKGKQKLKVKKEKKKRDPGEPRKDNPFMRPLKISPKLLEFLDLDQSATVPRPTVVKMVWDHIKANNLQNPNDKREILCDEKMQPVFGKKQTMFSMNKVLKDHLFKEDE